MTKLIAMFAACGVGCSWIGVHGPPSPLPEHGTVTCSDSYALPIVDSVVAAIAVLALFVAAQPCNSDACTGNGGDGQGIGTRGLLVFTGVALAPFGISAIYGYSKVSSCVREERASPFFCTTSPANRYLCFCSSVQAECEERQRSFSTMGATVGECTASPMDACQPASPPSPTPPVPVQQPSP